MSATTVRADSAGVGIAYERAGEGPPLLLIMGLGYARRGWGPTIDLLAERFSVAFHDNRGIGESDVPPGPYTAGQLADDALAVLDDAGIDRTHVLGASLGGMAAQELALAHPERVERLVLACTTPGGEAAYPLPEQTVALFAEAPTLPPEVALHRFVVNSLGPDAPAELVEEVYRWRLANPPDPVGWQAQAAAGTTYDGGGRAARIAAPTLIVHGTADNVVDPRNATLLGELIPGARVELLDGCGHLLFWERPRELAALVTEFVGG